MRFQATTTGTPTVANVQNVQSMTYYETVLVTVQRRTIVEDSGHAAVIIPGESKKFSVIMHQLTYSWTGIETPGKIEVRSPETQPMVIFQNRGSGNLVVPCYDEQRWLSRYGLRAANNSIGGSYSITAHYTVKEL